MARALILALLLGMMGYVCIADSHENETVYVMPMSDNPVRGDKPPNR
jgi:hypothetical protein